MVLSCGVIFYSVIAMMTHYVMKTLTLKGCKPMFRRSSKSIRLSLDYTDSFTRVGNHFREASYGADSLQMDIMSIEELRELHDTFKTEHAAATHQRHTITFTLNGSIHGHIIHDLTLTGLEALNTFIADYHAPSITHRRHGSAG